jgi:2-polyprenyl-6-methoxyphenol hydroxylase-like FAD-dependent oxidoreductase
MDLSYQDYKSDWFGLGIQRAALFELLLGAIKSETVNLRFGVTIEEITNSPRRRVIDANGRTYGPYDLVIAADGANSSLRTRSGLDLRAPLYPWGAVWALCPDPESAFSNQLQQVYDRASIMIGISPVGRMPDETAGPPLVTFFWSLRRKDLFKFQNQAVDVWKSEVRGYWPEAALLLESIENIGDLAPATYRDVVMRRWIDRGLVFIGDAAHGMSPQLGQGANLALVDAWVLAACLRDNSCDLSGALESYQQIRLSHTGFYQFASRWLTPVFQSNSRAIATARDFLMGPACKMPILGNEMLKTLVGVRQGLWDTWAAPVMDQRVDE